MTIELNPIEIRIIGALAEKSITVKDQYPLTFNSLLLACNQKSSREPVMNLDVDTMGRALQSLVNKGFVARHQSAGERVPKFTHFINSVIDSDDDKVIAIFIVLFLRGPQTAGEIKNRTERLCNFESTAQVEALLQELCAKTENPLIAVLPRQSGQKEARYAHLFCGMPAVTTESNSPVIIVDKRDEKIAILENKIAVLEQWVKNFTGDADVLASVVLPESANVPELKGEIKRETEPPENTQQ